MPKTDKQVKQILQSELEDWLHYPQTQVFIKNLEFLEEDLALDIGRGHIMPDSDSSNTVEQNYFLALGMVKALGQLLGDDGPPLYEFMLSYNLVETEEEENE